MFLNENMLDRKKIECFLEGRRKALLYVGLTLCYNLKNKLKTSTSLNTFTQNINHYCNELKKK